ncbi:Rap1-DNA-bind-domain-containing protein, partial [Ascoidea rubescens DSM 1968]
MDQINQEFDLNSFVSPENSSIINTISKSLIIDKRFNKNEFTKIEDTLILDQIRRNPLKRGSHKFFDQLAINYLPRHTGNSIRYRFRNLLVNDLEYLYKVDSMGNLVKDSNGNFIKVGIDEIPLNKRVKFSSIDDYQLCLGVLSHLNKKNSPHKNTNLNNKLPSVPLSYFAEFEKKFSNHSKFAWKDRYRKFVCSYGLMNYIDYYNNEIKNNRTPDPI